jgi:hypothetical protein
VAHLEVRHLVSARHSILHEGPGEELAFLVVEQLLFDRGADALGEAAMKLALDDHRVDRPPAVVHGDVAEQRERAGLDVHLDHDALDTEGPGDRNRDRRSRRRGGPVRSSSRARGS